MINSTITFVVIFSLAGIAFYVLLAYVLPWFQRKRVAGYELPESWEKVLNTKHPEFLELDDAQKDKIRKIVKVFMAEKYLEPDELKWDEQIMICATMALKVYQKRHRFLSKLSTIRIGKEQKFGQGFIEVPTIAALKEIEYKKWF